jgi:hypothetical protein
MPGNESMLAAQERPGNGRDSDKESNAVNAKDGCGLQGISGRVGNPQATTGAPTEWDDEKAAYVAANGATHQAPRHSGAAAVAAPMSPGVRWWRRVHGCSARHFAGRRSAAALHGSSS